MYFRPERNFVNRQNKVASMVKIQLMDLHISYDISDLSGNESLILKMFLFSMVYVIVVGNMESMNKDLVEM